MRIFIAGRNASTALTTGSHTSLPNYLSGVNKLSREFIGDDCILVVCDADRESLALQRTLRVPHQKSVLIRSEPRVVCPQNYSQATLRRFDRIFDFGRTLASTSTTFNWPQNWPSKLPILIELNPRNSSRMVMINANKLSLVSGELYSLRRAALHLLPVDVFGPAWDSGIIRRLKTLVGEASIALLARERITFSSLNWWFAAHQNYLGVAEDKISTMKHYRFALVIENSIEYMSEKLIDAFVAGCIPIYVGPDPVIWGIPEDLVFHSEPSTKSIEKAFSKAKSCDYGAWSLRAMKWLNSSEVNANWPANKVFERVLAQLELSQEGK